MGDTIESNDQPMETTATSSVEITFKTIARDVFKLTLPLSITIGAIKEQIFRDKGENFEVERQKLIYDGKVLEDSQTLDDIKVDEKKFIVFMVSKKKVEQPIYPSSSPSNAAAIQTPISTAITPDQEATIMKMCEMGYEREQAIKALRAAFWNSDRAVEYLCTQIPEISEPDIQKLSNPFAYLNNYPQFAQVIQSIRSNPENLPQIIEQFAQSHPNLVNSIRSHPEDFLRMLNQADGSGQLPSLEQFKQMLGMSGNSHQIGFQVQGLDDLAGVFDSQGGRSAGGSDQMQGLDELLKLFSGQGGQIDLNASQVQGLGQLLQVLGGQAGAEGADQLQGLGQLLQALGGQEGFDEGEDYEGEYQEYDKGEDYGDQVEDYGEGENYGEHQVIPLSEEDRAAIQRIQAMGFDEQTCIVAYLACDKNEELAVNYILSQMKEPSEE